MSNPYLVDYASTLVLELNPPSGGISEPFVTVKFKNGTNDGSLHEVTLGRFGADVTSVPLSTFVSTLQVCLFSFQSMRALM